METKVITVEYDKIPYKLYVDISDARAGLVESRKGTQEGKVKTWKNIIRKLDPSNVFDIGTNYGEFLVPVLDIANNVKAYEPNKNVFSCLQETIKGYGNVKVHNAAVGNSTKTVTLHIPKSSGNGSVDLSCVTNKTGARTQDIQQFDIAYILDDVTDFVMKIDVEGIEHTILQRIHEKDNFINYVIMFEFNRFGNKEALDIIDKFLIGKQVMGIGNDEKQLIPKNFHTYKSGDISKFGNAHDIIVSKNITW